MDDYTASATVRFARPWDASYEPMKVPFGAHEGKLIDPDAIVADWDLNPNIGSKLKWVKVSGLILSVKGKPTKIRADITVHTPVDGYVEGTPDWVLCRVANRVPRMG